MQISLWLGRSKLLPVHLVWDTIEKQEFSYTLSGSVFGIHSNEMSMPTKISNMYTFSTNNFISRYLSYRYTHTQAKSFMYNFTDNTVFVEAKEF